MNTMSIPWPRRHADDLAWHALRDRASALYRPAGRYAWHFARGKLRLDPVFRHLVEAGLVPAGARVLDLGCGDGALLAHLQQHKACTGYGVEIDDANVLACVKRGVNVIQLNLDQGLALFGDQSFDVVLQIDTLQHLRNAGQTKHLVNVGLRREFFGCHST